MDNVAGGNHRYQPADPEEKKVIGGFQLAVLAEICSRLQIGRKRLQTRGNANWELIDSVAGENHRLNPADPAQTLREAIVALRTSNI